MKPELKKLFLIQVLGMLAITIGVGLLLVAGAYWSARRDDAAVVSFLCSLGCYLVARWLGKSVDKGIKRYDAKVLREE